MSIRCARKLSGIRIKAEAFLKLLMTSGFNLIKYSASVPFTSKFLMSEVEVIDNRIFSPKTVLKIPKTVLKIRMPTN